MALFQWLRVLLRAELASHAEAEAAAVTPPKASPAALAASAAATPAPADAAPGSRASQAADAGALTPAPAPGAQPTQATPAAAAHEDVERWMAQLRTEHAYALLHIQLRCGIGNNVIFSCNSYSDHALKLKVKYLHLPVRGSAWVERVEASLAVGSMSWHKTLNPKHSLTYPCAAARGWSTWRCCWRRAA